MSSENQTATVRFCHTTLLLLQPLIGGHLPHPTAVKLKESLRMFILLGGVQIQIVMYSKATRFSV